MTDQQQSFKGVQYERKALLRQYEEARRICERHNTYISRIASGTRAMVGDLVLLKEADAVWMREGVHQTGS